MHKNIEELAINTLKMNGVAAVNQANSGHPGIVLSAANIVHTLFTRHMNFDPQNPQWINRDRFILSVGHGSALLYSLLRVIGLISKEDLKQFRQLNSKTPGHPEYRHTKGVEATTGPLGQGIAIATGVAIAQAHLEVKFKEIDHYTYVLCGDGDIQEGVANEAFSLAGHLRLNKLIVLYDSNNIQLDTRVEATFTEDVKEKMTALGFNYILVEKNEVDAIDQAITKAKQSNLPSFIEVKTIIGEGAPKANTSEVHGAPLGKDIEVLKQNLNWTYDEFELPQEVKKFYEDTLIKRSQNAFNSFKVSKELQNWILASDKEQKIEIDIKENIATRASSGAVIEHLNKNLESWIGGSADLSSSTKAKGADGDFSIKNRKGRNILFGVREFAMAAIANGLALHSHFKPFVSTFFVFADYLKPALRLSSLMQLPVTYIFTHDSVQVGEDGPTHEPIEQLAMLRSVPNLNVLRPADEKEVKASYEIAINSKLTPTVIVLTRQNITSLANTNQEEFKKGAYLVRKSKSKFAVIATGSELAIAQEIANELDFNLISLSNWQNTPIWDASKAVSIELASTFGWTKHASLNIGIDTFGISAPVKDILKQIGFEKKAIIKKIKTFVNK
ncbi:transketolase [Mesomycoplasma hyorhinis]|uniref:transketolase n=1 Tax=Mesomycoplasma hyorhinis TaxID=2100 RepID=UPI001C04FE55|nr:transketolase [Mesomycoplasma hyorhinis]